ncbi:MAG: hypothetical protein RIF41_39335 [Polyangiaceae bacterium]
MSDFLAQFRHFTERVVSRFEQIMTETEAEANKLLAHDPPHHEAIQRALDAVGQRLNGLKDKLFHAWHEHAPSIPDPALRRQGLAEAKSAVREMHDAAQRQRVRLDAATAHAMWPRVLQALTAPAPCDGCGADLPRSDPLAMATLTCPHCGAVTQFVPDAILKLFYPKMAEQLALARHIELAMANKALYRAHQDWADEQQELTGDRPEAAPHTVAEVRRREAAYFATYLDELSKLMPLTDDERRQKLDAYIGARVERILAAPSLV